MVDLLTRLALLGLFAAVLVRSLLLYRVVVNPSRSRSLAGIAVGVIVPMGFWVWVAVTAPLSDGSIRFTVWWSRVAFGILAVVLILLQAFIRDAEHHGV